MRRGIPHIRMMEKEKPRLIDKGKVVGAAGLALFGFITVANAADLPDSGKIDPAAAKVALAFASSVAYLMADEKPAFEFVIGPSYHTTLYVEPKW